MRKQDIDQQNWSIDTLNKAYRQGYLFGLSGESMEQCPYRSEVIAAAWEAGWHDGHEHTPASQRKRSEEAALA